MRVSIAIATRNRAELLTRCLNSLERVVRDPDVELEILVCDNGSTDQTPEVVDGFGERLPVRRLSEPRRGKVFALLRLIEESQGDWMLFLDDDVTVDEGWLQGYLDGMERYPRAVLFGGQILPEEDTSHTGSASYIFREFPHVQGVMRLDKEHRHDRDTGPSIAGGNMAFRRDCLTTDVVRRGLRMFAELDLIGEDSWLLLSHLQRGYEGRLLVAPKVYHHIPASRSGLRWYWNWHTVRGRTCRRLPRNEEVDLRGWIVTKHIQGARGSLKAFRHNPRRIFFSCGSLAGILYGYLTGKNRGHLHHFQFFY